MRIGVDIRTLSDGNSGVQVFVRNILDNLQKIDTENDYILFERIPSKYKILNPKWKVFTKKTLFPGIIWLHILLPVFVKLKKIDVLWSPFFIKPLLLSKRVKSIITIYDLTYKKFPETMEKKQLRFISMFIKNSIHKCSKITTISQRVKNELLEIFPEIPNQKIEVTPCGSPDWTLPQQLKQNDRGNYLFFPGNFEPRKNLKNLIEALEILWQKGFQIEMKISGSKGWKNTSLYHKIEQSPIRNQLSFLGFISQEELIYHYTHCKALIFPSIYEGFGMPVLEALYCNCLVLTSKNSVMEDICGENAIYFDASNPNDISNMISNIYSPGFKLELFTKSSNLILDRYSWHNSAEQFFNLFDKVKRH